MSEVNCRYFNGYKPCGFSTECSSSCLKRNIPTINILLIHLGAIGAVVRSTSLLESIHLKYPGCRLIWVTDSPSHVLLKNHPLIDHVYKSSDADLLELSSWDFDVAFCVDKSRKAAGILKKINVDQVFGFKVDSLSGAVLPATMAANELWEIGLSDQRKFFENKKPETQLIHEALELGPWMRCEYSIPLSESESELSAQRKVMWKVNQSQPVIGINTGCSQTIPAKKWTVEYHRQLIQLLIEKGYENIVLLGGPEDSERNAAIANGFLIKESPTHMGLRDGLVSVDSCDLVVTGDSLGMHMAIARKKYVIAWFGPTCAQEIDLYERGEALITKAPCAPCWKRTCDQTKMCYDQVEIKTVFNAIQKGEKWLLQNQTLSFRPPSLEISF